MEYLIEIQNLRKKFNDQEILKNVNLKIKDKEIITIIGHSGSGKTTLLKCLNLLETPDSGAIIIDKQNILDPGVQLSELRTKVGMVFQSFNLFEGKTVLENCCLAPMKVLKASQEDAEAIAVEKLTEMGLEDYVNYDVSLLSGGQKQRVAIARALCMKPQILLLDEPTSALDPDSTHEVLRVLQKLSNNKKITLVIITHEMNFAKKVSHTICFLEKGEIVEKGTSKEIFETNKYPKSKAFFEEV
ncbi:amino acid ABC transporter ATP-binding protein [Candidatus Phytoplasma meliae]|uniref:Amino acid ABC transporter ATP-binding protein n=1 Tax=Candidatus Phytoplasma meliae TaxID=1848402 RepID=A0ABS5CZ11_9MOLU|nr:amino acid ABC transporter ATP-binding protein [Candidatus Phytoplasma meliae]MBP5835792.1 amino acid ABC transporter ATP-binding protein [Candidatus Phytoplasma meliae]MBP5836197.1 amino acid ABC transporter ATP-binding protein [Candidatus Phytoplasma meliae]